MAQAKRKQKFFDVSIPSIGKETQLYAYDLEALNGRSIKYDLTRLLRGKSMLISLKVETVSGPDSTKAVAHPKELKVMPSF